MTVGPMVLEMSEVDLLSDEELTRQALAADPDAPLAGDAVPLSQFLGDESADTLLPAWYMPAPAGTASRGPRWRRWVAITLIVTFLAIDAYGLCSTYGWVTIA